MNDYADYVESPRVSYESGACFVRVCPKCARFVKSDDSILINDDGLKPGPTATCSKHGRVEMPFEGFIA